MVTSSRQKATQKRKSPMKFITTMNKKRTIFHVKVFVFCVYNSLVEFVFQLKYVTPDLIFNVIKLRR